jgi:hypothetical protein
MQTKIVQQNTKRHVQDFLSITDAGTLFLISNLIQVYKMQWDYKAYNAKVPYPTVPNTQFSLFTSLIISFWHLAPHFSIMCFYCHFLIFPSQV